MSRERFRVRHRHARLGNLGTLAMSMSGVCFQWFLTEVYDLRFPQLYLFLFLHHGAEDILR